MILTHDEHARLNELLDGLEELRQARHWQRRQAATTANEAFETVAALGPGEIKNLALFCIAELDTRNQGDMLDIIDSELRKRL